MTAAIFLSAGSAVFASSAAEVVSPSDAVTAPAKSSRMTAASDFVIKNGVLTEYTGSGGDVVIPDTVTSIGEWAFCECSSLKSVTIPDSVTSIGMRAFVCCTSLTNVTIPNSVTSIGECAFADCKSLTNVTMSNSVTNIDDWAFEGCIKLAGITIPNSVTSLGHLAFNRCKSLKSVTIPKSVKSIGDAPFGSCDSLTGINVDKENTNYSSVGGVLYDKSGSALIQYPAGKKGAFVIPSGVKSIEYGAFSYCKQLTSVTIPASVTSIGGWAFEECLHLKTVNLFAISPAINEEAFIYINEGSQGCPLKIDTVNYAGSKSKWKAAGLDKVFSYEKTKVNFNCDSFKITSQPKSQTVNFGKKVTLSVKTNGSGLKYQWYFKKKGQKSFSKWQGRISSTETATPNATWDGIQLYCKITDSNGNSVNSKTVTVKVKIPLKITSQPKSQTVANGKTLKLSVAAQGNGLKYQWYYMKKGQSKWHIWKGHTTATQTVKVNSKWNGMKLYCKVTDANGKTVNSKAATVKVVKK